MSVRAFVLRACVAVCALGASLAFSASGWAAYVHPYQFSFGSFSNVQGVAVDSSSGDVYVYDGAQGEVLKFDASGEPAEFSSTKSNSFGGAGFAGGAEGQIAVDNSSGPAKGDIYVAHAAGSVNIFNPAGEKIGELTEEAGDPWGEACGVAVDASGNVYVGLNPSHINKYAPAASPATNADYVSSIGGLTTVCNVGADSAGNAYAITWSSGPVTRYEPGQFGSLSGTGSVVDEKGSSMAVDPTGDEVYVDEQSQIAQFGAEGEPFGEPVATFASSGPGAISSSIGIAVSGFNGDVYVSDGNGAISVFGPGAVIPDVVTGAASGIQSESATVSGTVNPGGVAVSECNVEYGPTASYGQSQACAEAPGEIGSGTSPVEVHANLTGLTPGTTYHYRLVAANANGTSTGSDQTFIVPGPPIVSGESVVAATRSEAEVKAKINPGFSPTTYHVEYGLSSAYGNSTPESTTIGSDGGDHTVTTHITGLTPGASYHFRFVATNGVGATPGADATFTTYPAPPSSTDTCANAEVRALQSAAYLPDCRAYELASPPDKDGASVASDETFTQSAVDGNAIKWTSNRAFGDAVGVEVRGVEYVSQRGSKGWTTHAINPPQKIAANEAVIIYNSQDYQAFSDDLTKGVYYAFSPLDDTHPNVEGVPNLYLRSDVLSAPPPGSYELLSDSAAPLVPNNLTWRDLETRFTAASKDFSHITFESIYNLTADAAGTNSELPKLYEWHNGVVTLVGVLPNGDVAEGAVAGQGAGLSATYSSGGWTQETISSDGSRIVFTAPPFSPTENSESVYAGNLYMRIDSAETVQVNVDERSEPDPNGVQPATFWKATSDESQVFFTTRQALTDDATPAHAHFYRYDVEAPADKHLTLLAQEGNAAPGFTFVSINGISADGSYVYFTFNSPLREGDPPKGGLYVWHNGSLRFVVSASHDSTVWGDAARSSSDSFRVTPDGKAILFESSDPAVAQLVGYNDEVESSEIYLYNYDSERILCASCNPSGAPPVGRRATFTTLSFLEPDIYPVSGLIARNMYLNRALSKDGRYGFFDTSDSLVPEDSNGRRDVYEYDASAGRVQLISGGSCNCDSVFMDASADGGDVFFTTHQSLVRSDFDTSGDLYDARVNGGIASQNVAPPAPCEGDDCQGPAKAAPSYSVPSSATFAGGGNPVGVGESRSTHRTLTRAQKLARALRACHAKHGKRRARCEARARKRYGPHRSGKRASRRAGR